MRVIGHPFHLLKYLQRKHVRRQRGLKLVAPVRDCVKVRGHVCRVLERAVVCLIMSRRKRKVNLDHLGCVCENAARRKQIATRQWKIKRVLAQLCTQQERANLAPRRLFNLVHKARRKKSQVTIVQFQDVKLDFRVKFESPTHNMVLMTYTRRHPEFTGQ